MAPPDTIHLHPTAPLAERVLLPGDPGRALALAQHLIDRPLMFNHHRGLWGYTGPALADGEPLTIQSTGMGGPSAAIVLHELIALGARRAIRVGTCGAFDGLALGDVVVAAEALAADGTSRSLGAGERVAAHGELTAALATAANGAIAPRVTTGSEGPPAGAQRRAHQQATVVSTDLFYEPDPERERSWRAAGAIAVEMEAAALFTVGSRAGIPVACALVVSDLIGDGRNGGRERIDEELLLGAAQTMGSVALAAFGALV